MKDKSKLNEYLLVNEHKMKISKLENEIKELEDKLYHLEDENHLLHHRVKTLTKDTKVVHKSTRITKPINVPKNDPFYTEYGDKKTLNARSNFFTFFDYHWHSVVKSKMLWILLVLLPILFTTILHLAGSLEVADCIYWINHPGVADNPQQIASFRFEKFAITSFLAYNMVNWLIAIPLLVFTCILLPSFITISREDNLLKRLTINSMNRSQIFWFYMLSSTILFGIYLFVMFGIWLSVLSNFAENVAGVEMWEHGLSIFDSVTIKIPPGLQGFAGVTQVTFGVSVLKLLFFTTIFFFGLSALGFHKAMTTKSSRSLVAWGTGVFIFSQFAKLSVGILDLHPFDVEMGDGPSLDLIVGVILFCLKWMFVFTLPTVIFVALMITARGSVSKFRYGGLQVDEFNNAWVESPDAFFTIFRIIVVAICIALFIYVWYNKEKIIKFEASR